MDELKRDEEAREIWHKVYGKLSEGHPGLMGSATSRAEAQVMRLACLYALLDKSGIICAPHLMAALAVWEFCELSAGFIFGSSLGDPLAEEVWRALKDNPRGFTLTEVRDLFNRNLRNGDMERAVKALVERGLIRVVSENTGGRPAQRLMLAETFKDNNDRNDK